MSENTPEPPAPEPTPPDQGQVEQNLTPDTGPSVGGEMPTADHEQAELRANQSHASDVSGLDNPPNRLDQQQAAEPFGQAAGLPIETPPETAQPAMTLDMPTPGGNLVSPQLRDEGDQTQDIEADFKKEMLVRREFRQNARDVEREH